MKLILAFALAWPLLAQFPQPDGGGFEVIEPNAKALIEAFGLKDWPNQPGVIDLGGGRVLDLVPLPGHQEAAIALYDRKTGVLLTGDSVYPGRLYIADWKAFATSID